MKVIVGTLDNKPIHYDIDTVTYTVLDLESGQVFENCSAEWCLRNHVLGISKTGSVLVELADLYLSLNLERVDLSAKTEKLGKYFSDSLVCHGWNEGYMLWQFKGFSHLGTYNLYQLVAEWYQDDKELEYITTPFQEFYFIWDSSFKRSLVKAKVLNKDVVDIILSGIDSNEYCRRLRNYYDTKYCDR